MAGVLKWWPSINLELYEKCGVDLALKQRVEGCFTEVIGLSTSKVVQLHEAVVVKMLEADKFLEAIDKTTNSEATLRSHEEAWEEHRADAESIA